MIQILHALNREASTLIESLMLKVLVTALTTLVVTALVIRDHATDDWWSAIICRHRDFY